MTIRRRNANTDNTESKSIETFRAVIDENTSLSMYNKNNRSFCVIRKDLTKNYEIEVDASEAPIFNKIITIP